MTGNGSCDLRKPIVGRIYDALLGGKELLGGKDNYAEDRDAAGRLIAAIPDVVAGARANREFLGRAVRFLAAEAGIRQFVDIGAGLPTMGTYRAISFLKDALAPGSYLVVSHGTSDNLSHDAVAEMRQVHWEATAPTAPRAEDGIARFFDGLQMVPPGLCDVAAWRADPRPGQPGRVLFLGGIGRKL